MALHVADLHHLPGVVASGRDPVDIGNGDRERLLAEDVHPDLESGQHDLDVGARGRGDQHGVEAAPVDQRAPVGVPGRDREARAHRLANRQ